MTANPIGWGIGGFFLLGGIFFWIVMPDIWIGQIWVAVSVGLIGLFALMGRRAAAAEKLKREGIPAQAEILEMTQTGVYVNEQPQVKFKLRVSAREVEPFEVEKRLTVPMIALGSLGVGRPLSVYVDRADRSNVAIDWAGAAPATIEQPDGRAAVLEALRQQGVEAAHATAAADPATAVEDRPGEPVDRMRKLNELKRAKLITDEEFAQQRKRILEDV